MASELLHEGWTHTHTHTSSGEVACQVALKPSSPNYLVQADEC